MCRSADVFYTVTCEVKYICSSFIFRFPSHMLCFSVFYALALIKFTQPVLVEREKATSRQNTVREIQQRAATGGAWPQVIVFLEGTCTNRSCLISFKPGLPITVVLYVETLHRINNCKVAQLSVLYKHCYLHQPTIVGSRELHVGQILLVPIHDRPHTCHPHPHYYFQYCPIPAPFL